MSDTDIVHRQSDIHCAMSYDEIEIEDMSWSEELQAFTYPCPCGDLFQITMVGTLIPSIICTHFSILNAVSFMIIVQLPLACTVFFSWLMSLEYSTGTYYRTRYWLLNTTVPLSIGRALSGVLSICLTYISSCICRRSWRAVRTSPSAQAALCTSQWYTTLWGIPRGGLLTCTHVLWPLSTWTYIATQIKTHLYWLCRRIFKTMLQPQVQNLCSLGSQWHHEVRGLQSTH